EEELLDELQAVRERRPNRRQQRLAGQDHHLPDLLEPVLDGQVRPLCHSSHLCAVLAQFGGTQRYSALEFVAMELKVDRDSGVPVGTQLAWRLRSAIERGELGPGDRLPSLRDAASAAGVNVNTVRAAYAKLESAGVVTTDQGRGTFVAQAAGG